MVFHMQSVPHMRCNVSVDTVAISSYVKTKHNTHGLARPYSDVEGHSVLGAFASVGIQASIEAAVSRRRIISFYTVNRSDRSHGDLAAY